MALFDLLTLGRKPRKLTNLQHVRDHTPPLALAMVTGPRVPTKNIASITDLFLQFEASICLPVWNDVGATVTQNTLHQAHLYQLANPAERETPKKRKIPTLKFSGARVGIFR